MLTPTSTWCAHCRPAHCPYPCFTLGEPDTSLLGARDRACAQRWQEAAAFSAIAREEAVDAHSHDTNGSASLAVARARLPDYEMARGVSVIVAETASEAEEVVARMLHRLRGETGTGRRGSCLQEGPLSPVAVQGLDTSGKAGRSASREAGAADVASDRGVHTLLDGPSAQYMMPLVGLDAEWVAGSPVALLQLACSWRSGVTGYSSLDDSCGEVVLIRLNLLAGGSRRAYVPDALVDNDLASSESVGHATTLPPSLLELLADPSIIKAGVGIVHDLRLISRHWPVRAAGMVELVKPASSLGYSAKGLQRLTAQVRSGWGWEGSDPSRCADPFTCGNEVNAKDL